MSFIVCRGLGSPLSVPNGYGAETQEAIDGAVLSFENGGLQIHVIKFNSGAMVTFDDGDNYINRYFALTADQLAGDDWMLVKLTREGSNLLISIDTSEQQSAPLATPIKDYSGKVTIMKLKPGGFFDGRVAKNKISKEASDYLHSDVYDNAGKTLLPNR